MVRVVASFWVSLLLADSDLPQKTTPIGQVVGDLVLTDRRGVTHRLGPNVKHKVVVLAFLGVECPLARLYAVRLEELAKEFRNRGVDFLALDPNEQDSASELDEFVRQTSWTLPLCPDLHARVADQLGVTRTPEVALLDQGHVLRYRGRIDDQFGLDQGVSYRWPAPRRRDLSRAIEDVLQGRPVERPETQATGCLIGRRPKALGTGSITWSRDIQPIVERRCQTCHRPGEIAPFSLIDYHDVVAWGPMIAEVVSEGRMPPWHADPTHGRFLNDARLDPKEKQSILSWIAQGAPEGESTIPASPRAALERRWQIPTPDDVFPMAEQPFAVPAEGTIEYPYFVVDPRYATDRWIKAVECQPGAPSVVHHINVFVWLPEMGNHFTRDGLTNHLIGAYAPGTRVSSFPKGTAYKVPAGSKFVFQMHYTPDGQPRSDMSRMGVVYADPEDVVGKVEVRLCVNNKFKIAPGQRGAVVEAIHEFERDLPIFALSPHMHLRGRSFWIEAFRPDGTSDALLSVPRFDFNWQTIYELEKPTTFPKGTTIYCKAVFDNSAENIKNPDPSATVTWGDQVTQEMMIGYLFVVAPKDSAIAPPTSPAPSGSSPIARVVLVGISVLAGGIAIALVWALARSNRSHALGRDRTAFPPTS